MRKENSIVRERRLWKLSRTAAFAVIAVALLVSLVIFSPAAPKKITLLTGPEGSGYHELGKRYAVYLGDRGLNVEVQVTDGGFDNVRLLAADIGDTVAFAPSNIEHVIDDSVDTSHLVSLGSIAYEPLWLFFRAEAEVRRISDLAGLRVAMGIKGSVVNYVGRSLIELNAIGDQVEILPSEGQEPHTVANALIEGRVDAAFVIGGPAAPVIRDLLGHEGLGMLSFERADAYQAIDPGITKIVMPEGIIDLANNVPSEDLILLSATTNLVTLDTLYPGAVPLLLQAAADVHDQRRIVTGGESFPSAQNVSLAAGEDSSRLLEELQALNRASAAIFVPRASLPGYIDFRQFLHDLRERVSRA